MVFLPLSLVYTIFRSADKMDKIASMFCVCVSKIENYMLLVRMQTFSSAYLE